MEIKFDRRHLKLIAQYISSTLEIDSVLESMYDRDVSLFKRILAHNESEVSDDLLTRMVTDKKFKNVENSARDILLDRYFVEALYERFMDSDILDYCKDSRLLVMANVKIDNDIISEEPRQLILTLEDYKKLNLDTADETDFTDRAIDIMDTEYIESNMFVFMFALGIEFVKLYKETFINHIAIDDLCNYVLQNTSAIFNILEGLFTTRSIESVAIMMRDNFVEVVNLISESKDMDTLIECVYSDIDENVRADILTLLNEEWGVYE